MERPILFSSEMVRAILEGRKIQTRRIIKDLYPLDGDGFLDKDGDFFYCEAGYFSIKDDLYNSKIEVGDILWVRETWTELYRVDENGYTHYDEKSIYYAADGEPGIDLYNADGFLLDDQKIKWHPSIHMKREAARLFLPVTNVRIERLQDITEEDALLEGLKNGWEPRMNGGYITAMSNFEDLWDSIYGKSDIKKWESNPWVFVTEFEVTKNER